MKPAALGGRWWDGKIHLLYTLRNGNSIRGVTGIATDRVIHRFQGPQGPQMVANGFAHPYSSSSSSNTTKKEPIGTICCRMLHAISLRANGKPINMPPKKCRPRGWTEHSEKNLNQSGIGRSESRSLSASKDGWLKMVVW